MSGSSYLQRTTLTFTMCWRSLQRAALWSPRWFTATVILNIAFAIAPSIQVLAVGWMTSAMASHSPDLVLATLTTATSIGVPYLLTSLLNDVSQTQRSIQQTRFLCNLRSAIAQLQPSQLATAEMSSRIQTARSAVDYTLNGLAGNVVRVICAVITATSLMASLWHLSPLASLLTIASLLPLIAMYHVLSGLRRTIINQMSDNIRIAQYYTDQLVYQRPATELAALGTSHRMAQWADEPSLDNDRIVCQFGWKSIWASIAANSLVLLCIGAALMSVSTTPQSYSAATACILGIMSGVTATRDTGAALGQIIIAAPLMEAYFAVVDAPVPQPPLPPVHSIGHLGVDAISVRYPGRSNDTLHQVSICAEQSEIIAIVGPNGAGKTTLVKALLGIVPTCHGTITIDDTDLAAMPEPLRIAHYGLFTQEFGRYELTIRQSLLLATPESGISDIDLWQALDSAQAGEFVRDLPQGLDTKLGEQWGGTGISAGQWQRLSLARIYLRNAAIWLLDEPTSAVDAESEAAIFQQLRHHKNGHITIVITHRVSTLRHVDRIYVMDGGRFLQSGTFDELRTTPGRFRTLFSEEIGTAEDVTS